MNAEQASSATLLPEDFAELQPFANVFAAPNEADRDEALKLASPELKRIFVDMVWPLTDVIENYVEHNPQDESAQALNRLKEAAAEIAVHIGRPIGY